MCRLIECTIGHNNLNYLQSKIYPEDVSELCRFCEEEPETFDHLLSECPCFQQARFDIIHAHAFFQGGGHFSEVKGGSKPPPVCMYV